MKKICIIILMTFSSLVFSFNELPHEILAIIFGNIQNKELLVFLSISKRNNTFSGYIKSIKIRSLWALPGEIEENIVKDYHNIERIKVSLGPAKPGKLENFLTGFNNLKEVSLILQPVNSDSYIKELTSLTNLTVLRFFRPETKQKIITFEGFKNLTNLYKLCDLTISLIDLDDESQELLKTFPNIENLEIHDCNYNDFGKFNKFEKINQLINLKSLKLYGAVCSSELEKINNLTNLTYVEDKKLKEKSRAKYYDKEGPTGELTPEQMLVALSRRGEDLNH